jgi:hypothetical protein
MEHENGVDWIKYNKRLCAVLDECNKLPLGNVTVRKILDFDVVSNKDELPVLYAKQCRCDYTKNELNC